MEIQLKYLASSVIDIKQRQLRGNGMLLSRTHFRLYFLRKNFIRFRIQTLQNLHFFLAYCSVINYNDRITEDEGEQKKSCQTFLSNASFFMYKKKIYILRIE